MENIRKIRVFISSRCGEKYAIARKALKELLLTTGLIGEVYVFEDEPASSEDTRSAYLDEVDESNLCIFLVDNRDGASDAVLAEQKRAKEKGLRLIYIFCDEQEKNPTNMQLEIKDTLSEKYYVVSSFSEIVTKAYESVVNDIATVYRKRPKRDYIDQTLNAPAPNDSKEPDITESYNFFSTTNYKNEGENIAFNKDFINYLPKTEGTMFSMIFKEELESLKSSKSNEHDESLSSFLKTILYYTKLNDIEYENLTKNIISSHPKYMTKVLSLRFGAMYNCFKGNFVVALKKLQEALKEAVQNREFPVWFTLDIALDLRNVYVSIAEIPNAYDFGNEGQKYLNDSRGVLYYPTLDREVASFKSDLLKYYAKIKFATPYTTFLGNNIALIFKSIAQAYAIAMFNGSITHVNMTRKHIMETIYILSSMEVDHDLRMELVRICIIERDVDKLDVIEQGFPSGLEHVSSTDAEEIYNSLENISSDGNAMISKFIALSYLGNHLSDTSFSNYTEELLSFTSKWVEDEKRSFSCGKFIVKFMLRNINRINCNDIAKFVLNVYENKIYYLKDYIYDIVIYLPHYNVAKCLQIKIRKMLVSLIHEKEDFQLLKFRRAIFSFSKNASIDNSSYIKAIKSANLNFYEEELKLELLPEDSKEFSEYIRSSIQLAKGDNARQGLNGIRYSKSICPLQTILNILNFSSSKFDIGLLKDIIQLCLDTLGCLEQDVSTKDDAIKILIFLNRTYKSSKIDWKQIGHELWDNYDAFSKGYEDDMKKYSNYTYGLSYDSLLLCFGFKTSEKISDHILAVSQEDSYGKIKTLSILQYLFENIKTNTVEESVVMNCIQFAINETFSDTRDIKINAVQCLLELLKFNVESNAILNHLSKLMDDSLWSVKRTIIYGIDKIKECNEDYAKIILQKGSLDYNYLVRRAVDVVEGRNE